MTIATKTRPTFKWRPYQVEALECSERLFGETGTHPLVVIPTGGGKGPLSAELARRFIAKTKKRVIIATHVKELVEQNYKQVRKVAPHLAAGIFSASLKRKDRNGQVTIANVQSICRVADQFRNVGLLIIDEAHLLQHGDDGQYHDLIRGLRQNSPDLQVLGLTATPWRTNSGNLTEAYKGTPPLFNELAYDIGIAELVGDGYLTKIVARATAIRQNTTGVDRRGGEYIAKQLDEAVNQDPLNNAITEEAIELAANRKSILDFCVSVDHARRVAATYEARGIPASFVAADNAVCSPAERDRRIAAFKAGRIRVLANCGILTTGFDHPGVDCIVHRRPTASPGLFLQITGRGTRVVYADGYDLSTRQGRLDAIANGGKPDCLMLDFAGNTARHGLIDEVQGVFKKRGEPDASDTIQECPKCHSWCSKEDTHCHNCGHEFEKRGGWGGSIEDREDKLSSKALADAAMNHDVQEFPVLGMRYSEHIKPGRPVSFKISFSVPGENWPVTEWWHLNAEGWLQTQARGQWRKFTAGGKPPSNVEEALRRAHELMYPSRIWARRKKGGNFWEIVGASFEGRRG